MTIGPIGRPLGVAVSLGDIRPRGRTGWRVRWRVRNTGDHAVTVRQAWHPHGRFRSSRLARQARIAPGETATIELPARMDARAGETVENCFLILRVSSGRERYRVLARFTLRAGPDGTPRPTVEAVDAHPADR